MQIFRVCLPLLLCACAGAASTDASDSDVPDTDVLAECVPDHETCSPTSPRGQCGGVEGSQMLPGSDCLACHSVGGDREAPTWTAAGTVFTDLAGVRPAKNVSVVITDAQSKVVTLVSNSVGNFYTSKSLTFPIDVTVDKGGRERSMLVAVDEGGCNSCHACEGEAGGKLYAP